MKEVLILVLKTLRDVFYFPPIPLLKEGVVRIVYRLSLAFKLWSLNLAIFFTMIFAGAIFCFLSGTGDFFGHIWGGLQELIFMMDNLYLPLGEYMLLPTLYVY